MVKFISSPGSAYEVATGITAEEAAEQGLVVVEQSHSTNPPTPVYGRYKNAPSGHALGVTVAAGEDTKVVGGGSVATPTSTSAGDGGGDKGSLVNVNDPVIHGGTGDETVHADNAAPLANDAAAQRTILLAGAHESGKKPEAGKKNAK